MHDTPLLNELVTEPIKNVNDIIRQHLHSDVGLIRQVAEYIITAGGKRLRPVLTLLSGQAMSYSGTMLYELAAMVECIHTATLLHDDVVDESDLRRGKKTANSLFGNAASVLIGDFIYTRAFQIMVRTKNMRILEVMAEATNVIAEGEVMQLLNIGNTNIDETQYLKVIQSKTAKLFEAAARVGAIIANASEIDEESLAAYGRNMGTAFQIIDDVLDYSGDAAITGKALGDDLAEGKPTLPLIYTIQHSEPEVADMIRKALENADRKYFNQVLTAIQSCDALKYAQITAINLAEQAIAALAPLPSSKAKNALIELAHVSTTRQT